MTLFIDTNILIDLLSGREPFKLTSLNFFTKAVKDECELVVSSSSITDVMYIMRKYLDDKTLLRTVVQNLLVGFAIADVTSETIHKAFESPMEDYEDAVLAECALQSKATYIITRDKKDFIKSPVPILTPEEYYRII